MNKVVYLRKLNELQHRKKQADLAWDSIYGLLQHEKIDPLLVAQAIERCNVADAAFIDEKHRLRERELRALEQQQ